MAERENYNNQRCAFVLRLCSAYRFNESLLFREGEFRSLIPVLLCYLINIPSLILCLYHIAPMILYLPQFFMVADFKQLSLSLHHIIIEALV